MPITQVARALDRSEAESMADNGLFGAWLEGWAALGTGATNCLTAGLRGAPVPLDLPRWLSVATQGGRPSWATAHEIVFDAPIARLRDFSVPPDEGSSRRWCCRRRRATTRALSTTPPVRARCERSSPPG